MYGNLPIMLNIYTNVYFRDFIGARMTEVTTEAIRHAKLQSNHHHKQNKHRASYRPDATHAAQPSTSSVTKGKKYHISLTCSL